MKTPWIAAALIPLAVGLVTSFAPPRAAAPLHCQVPCGIYGDQMRIGMMLEDAATIEKGMTSIVDLGKDGTNHNQIVRWVVNKDTHAQAIQETVASYWLAQRVKKPADDGDRAKYLGQLELMHGITVAAMKCKQTTDKSHVEALRTHVMDFAKTYFSKEDLEHLEGHRGG